MLKLFTDTDLDITPAIAERYGYSLISMPYSIDGVTVYPYEDFDEFDGHGFYDILRSGVVPNTGSISEDRYINYFEPVLASGDDILYVHFSRAMTMTFDNMDRAIAKLKKKYPDRTVYTIDTRAITILGGNIAMSVGDLYQQGKSAEEIIEWAKTEIYKYAVYFFADDLTFFRHSGRVGGLAATMGTLLGVRPIIYISPEGKMESIGKERGRAKAMDKLISYVDELGEDVANHRIIIGHTDAPELAEEIKKIIIEKYGENTDITVMCANPTVGSHCGPNSVGISFYAKHR